MKVRIPDEILNPFLKLISPKYAKKLTKKEVFNLVDIVVYRTDIEKSKNIPYKLQVTISSEDMAKIWDKAILNRITIDKLIKTFIAQGIEDFLEH